LAGFTEQLWFLPFLAVVTILAAAPAFVIARMGSKSRVLIMFLLFSGIIVALLPSPIKIDLETHPASYWFALSWGALPSALMVFSIIPFCKHVKLSLLAVMLAFFAWMLLWLPVGAECTNLLQNVSGVILILCAFLAPSLVSFKGAFRQLGELALPVYLLHPLFVHAVQAVGHRLAHLPVSVGFDVVVLFGGLVGSGLSAWYLQRIPPLKSLVMLR
jgi:surface polysaccharide O-acyltransferase-like enzyme